MTEEQRAIIKGFNIDLDGLQKWDKVKDEVKPRLIPVDRYMLFEGVTYTEFLNLLVVYCISVGENEEARATVIVKDSMLDGWGITKDELHEQAVKNMHGYLMCLVDVLSGNFNQIDLNVKLEDLNTEFPMYYFTNAERVWGASEILDLNRMNAICKLFEDDVVIIPSSVHETLLIPASKVEDMSNISDMVKFVNAGMVGLNDRLSDIPYLYSVEKGFQMVEK